MQLQPSSQDQALEFASNVISPEVATLSEIDYWSSSGSEVSWSLNW